MACHCNDFSARPGRPRPARHRARHARARRHRPRRRSFLARGSGLALSVFGGALLSRMALEEGIARAAAGPAEPVLVSIFLSGGLDSLSLLAPVGDARYASLRPTLGLRRAATADVFSEDDRLQLAPERRAAARPAPRREGQRDAGDRLRRRQPVALHLAPLLGGRRGRTRRARSAGSAATSTATAPPTTRCRACRSTGAWRPRWRPRTCRSPRSSSPEYFSLDARDVWDGGSGPS